MAKVTPKLVDPEHLGPGGRALWDGVAGVHELTTMQQAQLLEACRIKDRLDKLDKILRGHDETWATLVNTSTDGVLEVRVDQPMSQSTALQNMMKQLLASLRLPESGTIRNNGASRGVYAGTTTAGKKVSPLERARQRVA